MSAITGIYYRDRRPVPTTDIEILAAHNRPFGSDGGHTVTGPGLAMQAHVRRFDRFSAMERQPVSFARGSWLTWDGRLDNRDDLLLLCHRELNNDPTDAALVAAAYCRYGRDILGRLIGDWSLALWDAESETLLLAKDYMGNRPLHYIEADDCFAWSTSLEALADRFDRFRTPDDGFIAGRLTYGIPPGITPFKDK